MQIPRILLGAALVAALSMPLVGQQPGTTGYYEVACVKVNPGQGNAAHEWVVGADHKLSQELVDSGRIQSAVTLRSVSPQGANAECDYVFVTFFNGLPPASPSTDEMSKALHSAGIQMTTSQFYAQRGVLGRLVDLNFSRNQTLVGEAKKGGYLVLNEMNAPDIGACLAYQKKIWQPLAEEMLKAGVSDGWATNVQVFPRGVKDGNRVNSVDFFPSLEAVFNQYNGIESGWKKVHPDLNFNTTMEQMEKLCSIEHTVLYEVVDTTTPKK